MGKEFSFHKRQEYIKQLTTEIQDVIIVGGGITGAGILLDTTTRGMAAALFEMQDFSEGTSSRSTKLVHGGLRYLKQFEFSLVREVGRERAIVFDNGPHVTKSEPMLLPIIKGGSIGQMGALFGLWLYDKLAGVKKKEQRRIIHKASVLAMEPNLRDDILLSGAYYYEYRTDDSRLTIELIKAAVERNAIALNYCKVIGFLYTNGKISGVKVIDVLTEKTFEVKARTVVNATGPWVDETDALDASSRKDKLLLSKGVHIVVDASRLPIGQAMYFDAGAGRMIFAIPREGKVYLGTTETEYTSDIANPAITREDRDYILGAVNRLFVNVDLKPEDVESGWAGLRPLIKQEGKKPGEISRKDETFEYTSGLISIAGGKLTGYRKMAERITDLLSLKLKKEYNLSFATSVTYKTPISGGDIGKDVDFDKYVEEKVKECKVDLPAWTESEIRKIISRYGTNYKTVFSYSSSISNTTKMSKSLQAELDYAMINEMAITPLDFFVRRTSSVYFDLKFVQENKDFVWTYMLEKLKWGDFLADAFKVDLDNKIEYLSSIKRT